MPEQQTADEDEETSGDDEQEIIPWAVHQPTARIIGEPTALIYMGEIDSDEPQPSDSYGVIFENPRIVNGDVFSNKARGDDTGTVVDSIDEDEKRPTDFRFLDGEDSDVASFDSDGDLSTDETGPSSYEQVDEIDADRILVFYNGMSGTRVGRTLDFNGQSYAKHRSDTGYLVKGLYQAHPNWLGAASEERATLAEAGKAPRVVRAPILRYRVQEDEDGDDHRLLDEPESPEVLVDVSHYEGTRGYELHIFDAEAFEEEFGDLTTSVDEMERGRYGLETDSEIEYGSVRYSVADSILEQAGYGFAWFDEWEEHPDGWELEYDLGGDGSDFGDLSSEVVTEEDFDEQKKNFAAQAAAALPDGKSPEDAFPGGFAGLVDKKVETFYQEPTEEDVDEMLEMVYQQTDWLDTADLD